ncbi:PepSY-like domain-containing protein [Dyadobacter helix]|nr:hypothetical protein [Dyadobacter sp. CECT 9275]
MTSRVIYACIALALGACNKVTDSNPQPANVPSQVVQLVNENYADASHVAFTEIVPDKIWQVELQTPQKEVDAAVSTSNLISSYRMAGDQVPDSLAALLQNKAIAGGAFTNFREEEYSWFKEGNYGKTFVADYNWNGESNLLQWGVTSLGGNSTYTLEMVPGKSKTTSLSQQDLPDGISQYLSQQGLGFSRCTVYKNSQDQNTYKVQVSRNNTFFELYFNHQNALVGGSDQLTVLADAQALPANIRNYLSNTPEYENFGFSGQFARIFRRTYNGVTSYDIGIQKSTGTLAGTQAWFIVLDQQGNVILRNYLGLH